MVVAAPEVAVVVEIPVVPEGPNVETVVVEIPVDPEEPVVETVVVEIPVVPEAPNVETVVTSVAVNVDCAWQAGRKGRTKRRKTTDAPIAVVYRRMCSRY